MRPQRASVDHLFRWIDDRVLFDDNTIAMGDKMPLGLAADVRPTMTALRNMA